MLYLERQNYLLALVFTFPKWLGIWESVPHDIDMPQRIQWYPFFGRYFILFKWKMIKWEYKDKDDYTIY